MSALKHDWLQAGSTGRAHLVAWVTGPRLAYMSACGMVRGAAWMLETRTTVRCGLCRRLADQAKRRGDPMDAP